MDPSKPLTPFDRAYKIAAENIDSLSKLIKEIEEKRRLSQIRFQEIARIKGSCKKGQRYPLHIQRELKNLLAIALNHSEVEEALIKNAFKKIAEINEIEKILKFEAKKERTHQPTFAQGAFYKMLAELALAIPLFVGVPGELAPPLCGAIPAGANYIARPSDLVAAYIKGNKKRKTYDNWILAHVFEFNPATNKYTVTVYGESVEHEKYILMKRAVVPLPLMRANPETDHYAIYDKNSRVMALYPNTTCFYKAFVQEPHNQGYKVLFSHNLNVPIFVPQRYMFNYADSRF